MSPQSMNVIWNILNSDFNIRIADAEAVAQAKQEFMAYAESQNTVESPGDED